MRTMQSFSWKRPCCSALPPLSRRLTNKPRVLKGSNRRVSELQGRSGGLRSLVPLRSCRQPLGAR